MNYINIARITKSAILVYREFIDQKPRSELQVANEKNLKDIMYNGYMSPKTRSMVRKFLSTWLNSVNMLKKSKAFKRLRFKPYLTFVTLTLPYVQLHSDYEIKRKALNLFILNLKRKHGIKYHFWRAESQKNGNIHFHLIIDKYVNHSDIRQLWNKILEPLGYIDAFENIYGHRNPNSTDIHKLTGISNVGEYVIKYCCKETGYRGIKGRIWGCSDELRNIKPYNVIVEEGFCDVLEAIKKDQDCKIYKTEEFEIIYCKVEQKLYKHSPDYYRNYKKYHWEILKELYHYPPKQPEQTQTLVRFIEPIKQEFKQLEIFTAGQQHSFF